MNEPTFLSGSCDHCGGAIEFPPGSAGQQTPCPLCGQTTSMTPAPPASRAQRPARKPGLAFAGVMTAICLVVAVAGWKFISTADSDKVPGNTAKPPPSPEPPVSAATPSAKANVASPTNAPAQTEALPPRSLDDLKAGPVSFEKAKSGSLIYAVGTLRNNSGHQRFGVTIEIELTDARGEPAGTAKDYRAVIEPRQEWRFRALVLNTKATQGKVMQVREE